MMGADGLRQATGSAVLAANYIAARLKDHFPVLYAGENGLVAHECILDIRPLKDTSGITVDDVAATVKQVESLGGGVMMAGEETPYGTLAAVTDPFGAFLRALTRSKPFSATNLIGRQCTMSARRAADLTSLDTCLASTA